MGTMELNRRPGRAPPPARIPGGRSVFSLDDRAIAAGVPAQLRGLPVAIIGATPYRELFRYQVARRTGAWLGSGHPGGVAAEASGVTVRRASLQTLRDSAYRVTAAECWCRDRGTRLLDADEALLEEYADETEARGVRPQCVNGYLGTIIDFLHFSAYQGWRDRLRLERKPGEGALLIMRTEDVLDIRTWYTRSDCRRFIGEFELGAAAVGAEILYATGLRVSELLALGVGRFPTVAQYRADRARRFLRITGKGLKSRRVPLTESICATVEEYERHGRRIYAGKAADACDALILGPKRDGGHGPMTARYMQAQFALARKASGLSGFSPHMLRHHYAAHYLMAAWKSKAPRSVADAAHLEHATAGSLLSAEVIILKAALGHARLETTLRYLEALLPLMGADLAEEYSAGWEVAR